MLAAFGLLEWIYLAILVVLVIATTVFVAFLVLQLFRAHSRR